MSFAPWYGALLGILFSFCHVFISERKCYNITLHGGHTKTETSWNSQVTVPANSINGWMWENNNHFSQSGDKLWSVQAP